MGFEAFEARQTGMKETSELAVAALQSEYQQEVGKRAGKEVEQKPEGKQQSLHSGEKQEPTAGQRATEAFEKFQETRQLTPALKKQFEDAIAQADRGPSPLVGELEKAAKEQKDKLDTVFPKSAQDEVKKLGEAIEQSLQKLPEDQQLEVLLALQFRSQMDAQDRAALDEKLKKVAPDIVDNLQKIDKILDPVLPVAEKLQATMMDLELEKNASAYARLFYGISLLQSGDKVGAKKYVAEAGAKNQALLENENYVKLATALGIDVESLNKQKK